MLVTMFSRGDLELHGNCYLSMVSSHQTTEPSTPAEDYNVDINYFLSIHQMTSY